MNILWFFHNASYQQLMVDLSSMDEITVGDDIHHTVTVTSGLLLDSPLIIKMSDHDSNLEIYQYEERMGTLTARRPFHLNDGNESISLFLTASFVQKGMYYTGLHQDLYFSADDTSADVHKNRDSNPPEKMCDDFRLSYTNNEWKVIPLGEGPFLNGEKVRETSAIQIGDILTWPFMFLSFRDTDVLSMQSVESFEVNLPEAELPMSEMRKKYPEFRRTPRMIYELPDEKVDMSFPAQKSDNNNRGLLLTILPPLVMLLVMGFVVLVQPRGIFILISMSMFFMTLITSTITFFREKKNRKKKEEKRHRVYTNYLEDRRKKLHELAKKQKEVLFFHYPSFKRMKYLTAQISDRIWERPLDSEDFLKLRLGIGDVPASYEISLSSGDMANRESDELMEQSQHMEEIYKKIKQAPVTVSLAEGAMGLIGKEAIVKNEIHQLVGQLAFSHSYHDLRFVLIFNEEEYKDWEWMKWLPHFQLPNAFARGLIYNEETRDQLLSSLYEAIRERDLEDEKEKLRFTPHIVFIVTNQQLISEHVILEYLEGDDPNLGISTIFASGTKENLTEHIHTLIRYINEREGDILIREGKAAQTSFRLDGHHPEGNETFARTLRTLDHQVGMTNSIPNAVSFLELFGAKTVEDLQIDQNWYSYESSKSLAVPIGLKGKDDIVELNLHEKAHGPHGLLAGTTGSGKSEFLQTFILSLAVHFHPHEVAFLLIDYKGGGMAQPFKNIPHLLGTITNIEGSKNFSARALASIKSELKRRQRLFDKYQVNHINDYTKLYKQGESDEPLPHLLLISDEFAELKNEEPDFIDELVSAARIGRSLGVHLILATQKPGGVISEQIWSNSRFKVALKVQDANDSKEILKNADAASITITGRGYLQVGNNEIYELFQSAWSGAPYMEETTSGEDDVALVTDRGLIPLSDVSAEENKPSTDVSEISMISDKIEEIQHHLDIVKPRSPWLPPLKSWLSGTDYVSETGNEFYIALTDEPDKQSQRPYAYRLIDDGNIGVFGSSGYGKSLSVMSILLNMAQEIDAAHLYYYIFDFGNGALLPIRQLPHTADYFTLDGEQKIWKFIRRMKDELQRRKQLFLEKEVSNIKMYNQISEEKLPSIFIVLDNYDLAKEEIEDFEDNITQFVRDGQSLGIFMIFSATRVNAIRQTLMNNLKTKIVHYLMDTTESQMIIGRFPYEVEPEAGRAVIKKDESYLAQVFLPAEGQDDFEVLDQVKQKVTDIDEVNRGQILPKPVPMLPSKLTMSDMAELPDVVHKEGWIPVGLDEEFVQPVYIDFVKNKHCMIFGEAQKGKTNVLKVILDTSLSAASTSIGVFDSIDRGLAEYANRDNVTNMATSDHVTEWLDKAEQLLKEREETYIKAIEEGDTGNISFSPVLLVVDGFSRFKETIGASMQDRVAKFMKDFSHLGFNIVAAGNHNEFSKGFDALGGEMKQLRQAVVLMKKTEQSLFNFPFERKEPEINAGFGYYVENGKATKVQIPHCTTEKRSVVV